MQNVTHSVLIASVCLLQPFSFFFDAFLVGKASFKAIVLDLNTAVVTDLQLMIRQKELTSWTRKVRLPLD